MNGELLFEAFGHVDERYIWRAGKNRMRNRKVPKLTAEDETLVDGRAEHRWLPVLAACLLALVLSVPLLLHLVKNPDSDGKIPAGGYDQPTSSSADHYCVIIDSFDTIHELLSVEEQGADLLNYLHTSHLDALGVRTEEDFDSLRQTLRATPIPSLNGLEPEMEFIENGDFVYAYFDADKVETAIRKEASGTYVQEQIKELEEMDVQWNHPIYLVESDAESTTLALDVNGHFVRVTVFAPDVESAVETVKGLQFHYFVDENTTVSGDHYRVVFSDFEQIRAFLAVGQQDEAVLDYLKTSGLYDKGVKTAEDVRSVQQILCTVPIPTRNGQEPVSIQITEPQDHVAVDLGSLSVKISKSESKVTLSENVVRVSEEPALWLCEQTRSASGGGLFRFFMYKNLHTVDIELAAEDLGAALAIISELEFQVFSKEPLLRSGFYLLEGDYESIPYVHLDTGKKELVACGGLATSYAEAGSYTVTGERLVAQTQSTVLTFEIVGEDRLILLEDAQEAVGWMTEGSVFIWQEDPLAG